PMILKSGKVADKEAKLAQIRDFIESHVRPVDLSDAEYASFINSACRFFLLDGSLWRCEPHGRHQLVVQEGKRYRLIKEAHDDLRHKGVFTVCTQLLLRFWWPMLVKDVKWYIRTYHECQIHQTRRLHIPPSVPAIGGLFQKAHIDTMQMPKAGGFCYIIQARWALSAYPEWRMLQAENGALDLLASRYNIRHIRISPYNSQANGIVERRHYDVREAIIKS
ncbi:hypothetical protein PAXRUDRAFT_74267, partial [Paxillus rubicundulus Ve08.2h10]